MVLWVPPIQLRPLGVGSLARVKLSIPLGLEAGRELVLSPRWYEGGLDRSLGPVGVASELAGTHSTVGVPGLIQELFIISSWDEAQSFGNPISGEFEAGNGS